MIKINIEIHPFGLESEKRTLFEGRIWNDATGTPEVGNYKYTLYSGEKVFNGEVKNYERKRPIQDLLLIVLNEISEKEKKSRGRSSKV